MSGEHGRGLRKYANLLLAVPCIAALCVPLYNFDEPRLLGIPFFYAWQLIWIWLGAAITWIVYAVAWKDRDS
jgi:hypothetical protein